MDKRWVNAMATEIGSKLDRRAAILQAAREVLATKGLEAAKISDIVARAGVAQGTFYLYFPSKSSLVIALTEEMRTASARTHAASCWAAPDLIRSTTLCH